MKKVEQRSSGLRRDLNDLVRDESGKISGSKIGTYAGQIIAGHLLETWTEPSWDVLAVLFLVLIAPEAYKRVLYMRWGTGTTTTTETATSSSKKVTT